MPRGVRELVVACALLATRAVFAQDVAAAEELYRRGVSDFRAEKLETACQEFGASYKLDPHPGVLFTLATCEARQGRIATASAHYDDFLRLVAELPPEQQAIHAERRQVATAERVALTGQIPQLTVVLPEGLPRSAAVRRDGVALDAMSIGQRLPVDPGEHSVTLEVPGSPVQEQRVVLGRGESKTVTLHLPAAPPAPPIAPRAAPVVEPPVRGARAETPQESPRTASYWWYLAAAVGVSGAAGTTAGILAFSDKGIVNEACAGPACTARGKAAADRGKTEALVSTVSFGVGIAGLATMAILLVVDPSHSPLADSRSRLPAIAIAGDAVGIGGRF
jgi:hypothetical protein